MVATLKRILVARYYTGLLAVALQAGLDNSEVSVEIGFLLKIAHPDTTAQGYLSIVERFLAGNNLQQRALALSVTGNEPNALALLNNKRNVAEKHKVAKTLGYILYLQVYRHKFLF